MVILLPSLPFNFISRLISKSKWVMLYALHVMMTSPICTVVVVPEQIVFSLDIVLRVPYITGDQCQFIIDTLAEEKRWV